MAITGCNPVRHHRIGCRPHMIVPGTTLLTELVAIVDGGGTLADVAENLTTRTEWTSKYPSFQTANEFAAEWLGKLVPEASAEASRRGNHRSRRAGEYDQALERFLLKPRPSWHLTRRTLPLELRRRSSITRPKSQRITRSHWR